MDKLNDLMEACHVYYTNKEVDQKNTEILSTLNQPLFQLRAHCSYPKGYRPQINERGLIDNTQFMQDLNIKLGARVMMVHNENTADSLVNGAFGRIKNIIHDSNDVKAIIVDFDRPETGLERIKDQKHFMDSHGIKSGVPLFRVSYEYALPYRKGKRLHSCKGKIRQFAIRLAWAATAHKLQGATICKESKLVVHGHPKMPSGLAYVMLSRCANLESIYLDKAFDLNKIKCNKEALEENARLLQNDIVPSYKAMEFDIFMVNVRSLLLHLEDLEGNIYAGQSRLIGVVETWMDPHGNHNLDGPLGKFVGASIGKGRGCGAFLKKDYDCTPIAQDTFQILRVKYENDVQVLFTYLSKDCDFGQLCQLLEDLLQENPSSLIIGDFNFDPSESNILTPFFQQKNFIQLITEPTHEQGRIIDHLYIPRFLSSKIHFEMTYPFFTDHAAIIVKFQNM